MGYLFLIGVVTLLVGYGIIGNARFEDRAKIGTFVFLAGAVMVVVAIADVIVRWVF